MGAHDGSGAMNRREFGALARGLALTCAAGSGCGLPAPMAAQSDGRLTARPRTSRHSAATGITALGLDRPRDAWLLLPESRPDTPLPLVVMLHGAGGHAERFLERFTQSPGDRPLAFLVPSSRGSTWDAIRGGLGPDVTFLDRALALVFDRVAVDAARVAIGGFSDGASYALTLGLVNGDLFRRVIAFSPGFMSGGNAQGRPQFFVSHGTADPILPIDRCSRRIVPDLQRRGYEVTYKEFDGGHEVPAPIAAEAFAWAAT